MRRMDRRRCVRGLVAAGFSLSLAGPAAARRRRRLTDPDLDAALVVEAASGKVIYARNSAAPRHPASLTKLMTLYLLFETLRAKELALQTELSVSAYAASRPRRRLRLRAGSTITVETAIKAMIVLSANNVTVAVAEAVGRSEPGFVALMNAKARAFRMGHTFYCNATGLPDDRQITTADDLVILARRLIHDFPQYFPYFSTRSMIWRGNEYNTHDTLIGDYPGVDGMKTGYVDDSGYSIVTTALRGKTRLIAVVMGGLTPERRDEAMTRLLDDAYARTAVAKP